MDDDAPPGVPEWVVTYGDMMSLLLTFFIMLVSMSQLKDEQRIRATMDSLKEIFGADESMDAGSPGDAPPLLSAASDMFSTGSRSEYQMKKAARNTDGISGAHEPVEALRDGRRMTLGGPALFARFSPEPTDELRATLDTLVDVLQDSKKQIAVRGHASPEPLPDGGQLADHQQLAFERAALVAEHLTSRGISPGRIVLSSAGAAEPRLKTRDPERQRLNDRVDVYLINNYTKAP